MHAVIRRKHSGFSLIELVIVVVIIGIIAAIAIPRMSRGAAGAADSTLIGDLAVMRKAIDLFAAEHGGAFPTDNTTIVNQLTQYTDASGAPVAAKDSTHIYGPYIRTIPKLPLGVNKGDATFVAALGGTSGWVYVGATGVVNANCGAAEVDAAGVKYNTY